MYTKVDDFIYDLKKGCCVRLFICSDILSLLEASHKFKPRFEFILS